ncbi:MAG: response regulator [Chitinivibrionales bacterium]|nr:response regulator [Chitinivibrionales bacterium]
MPHILFVDDNKNIRTLMRDFFRMRNYAVSTAGDAREALEKCRNEPFDMVISDINMPGMKGHALLKEVRALLPRARTMLMTSYAIDDYITVAKRFHISSIIPKTVPINFKELQALVDGILTGKIFGLQRYLLDDGEMSETYCIRSSVEARRTRDEIVELFISRCGTAGDMKLVLDEAITNAIYHAPQLDNGERKYRELSDVTLTENEYVYVECGRDSEKYGVAVCDMQGNLNKGTVLERFERHITGRGIMDESGRGIHMSRVFADTMVININPGVRTEVILLNYLSRKYKGYKPIYINELDA